MRFPAEAPDVSYARNQKLLKPTADPIIGDARKVGFELVRDASLNPSKERQP